MKKLILLTFIILFVVGRVNAVDFWYDVDTALAEVPVNIYALTDDTDFKTRETTVAYDASGMDLIWNFATPGGSWTQTAVTPTTGGDYDWAHQGDGYYTIEIPASGGASINNDTEGTGFFAGICDGVLHWRGPICGFRHANKNDLEIEDTTAQTNQDAHYDGTGYAAQANTIQWNGETDSLQAADTMLGNGTWYANAYAFLNGTGIANPFTDAITLSGGGTSMQTDASGYVKVSDGTGTGQIDTDSGTVLLRAATETQIDEIETDTSTTLPAAIAGISTTYLCDTTVATSLTSRIFTLNTEAKDAANAYENHVLAVTDADDGNTEERLIESYSSGRVVIVNKPFSFTPAAGDVARILLGAYTLPNPFNE